MTKKWALVVLAKFLAVGLVTSSLPAFAFIPPVPQIIKEIFDLRKPSIANEAIFRHRIAAGNGESIELEERMVAEGNRLYFLWRVQGQPQPVAAYWENQSYVVAQGKAFPARSAAWVKYLLTNSGDGFRDTLVAEQFIRRDQLSQFKPGFTPTGDPHTWELRTNYLIHDDIFLSRLPAGIAIAVNGLQNETSRKSVYFDKSLRGVYRLEWVENAQTYAWNFERLAKNAYFGYYPSRLSFEAQGVEAVSSELVSFHPLKDKPLFEFKSLWKQAQRAPVANPVADAALRVLLSYR